MVEFMEITGVLPDDVFEEILLRLPVKHLLPLKCVCNDWYALIGDSRFHNEHYIFQYAKHLAVHNDIPLFLDTFRYISDPGLFYLLSKRQGVDVVLNLTPDFNRDISPAFANDLDLRKLCVSCLGIVNGVVCLEWGRGVNYCNNKQLALWNPATREFKDVARWPVLPDNEPTRSGPTEMADLGFDIHANNFKILGLRYIRTNSGKVAFEFHLYSLKADSWKRIEEPPTSFSYLHHSPTDIYLKNGVTYWLAHDFIREGPHSFHSHYWILSFNLSTETFKESELPEGSSGCDHGRVPCNCEYERMIGKYKEGLGLYVNHTLENTDSSIEIWAVSKFSDDGNGVPLYWQRVCTIGLIHSFYDIDLCTIRVSGDLLLYVQRGSCQEAEGCIYDPCTCTSKFLGVGFSSCFSYVESLYCLSGRIY